MFNSPILDTVIGLIFILLLYSLLATSVAEGISSVFALRAKMLRKGIVEGMLAKNPEYNRWMGLFMGIKECFSGFWRMVKGDLHPYKDKTLGTGIYNHPIIKNYGSSSIYPLPSYLPKNNFSEVLIDELLKYFKKLKTLKEGTSEAAPDHLPDVEKIKYLIDYLCSLDDSKLREALTGLDVKIDRDTLRIFELHLNNSHLNMDIFISRIEGWYEDAMEKVSGWYKRQTQSVLLIIGLVIAIVFNVNIITISRGLSTDKDARNKLVDMAIKSADKYKDDPRVKEIEAEINRNPGNKDSLRKQYDNLALVRTEFDKHQKDAENLLKGDITNANNLLAIGWGNYGEKEGVQVDFWHKACYILCNFWKGESLLAYFLFGFGICLGAPFWFDMLQKVIRIRGTDKKEGTDNGTDVPRSPKRVQVNVNTNQNQPEALG